MPECPFLGRFPKREQVFVGTFWSVSVWLHVRQKENTGNSPPHWSYGPKVPSSLPSLYYFLFFIYYLYTLSGFSVVCIAGRIGKSTSNVPCQKWKYYYLFETLNYLLFLFIIRIFKYIFKKRRWQHNELHVSYHMTSTIIIFCLSVLIFFPPKMLFWGG